MRSGERHAGRRLAVLFAVLAGLFLMHGMSAGAGSGCHGGVMPMSVGAMPQHHGLMTMPAAGASPVPHDTDRATVGESCIPLRPDEFGGLAFAALAFVVWQGTDRRAAVRAPVSTHWPHGPPRRAVDLLHDIQVCRT